MTGPAPKNVLCGESVSFSVQATGTMPLRYQWFRFFFWGPFIPIQGATNSTLTLTNPCYTATIFVIVTNNAGSRTAITELEAKPISSFVDPPDSLTVSPGSYAELRVENSGPYEFTYQWQRENQDLPNATNASLEFSSAAISNTGNYSVIISHPVAQYTPAAVRLDVVPDSIQPAVLDTNFNALGGPDGRVWAAHLQTNGTLLIAGEFTKVNGVSSPQAARLLNDGRLDPTFTASWIGLLDNEQIESGDFTRIITLPDGAVAIGRSSKPLQGGTPIRIPFLGPPVVILESNGIPRQALALPLQTNGLRVLGIADMIVDSTGRLLVAGSVSTGTNVIAEGSALARFQANGALDTSYQMRVFYWPEPQDSTEQVRHLELMPDGKVVAAGTFSNWGNYTRPSLVRLHQDGTVDESFTPSPSRTNLIPEHVTSIVETGGDIIVSYLDFAFYPPSLSVRLGPTGETITNFAIRPDLQQAFFDFTIIGKQSNGKLLAAACCAFTPLLHGRILRLHPNGDLDTTWSTGDGFYHQDTNVFTGFGQVLIQPDDRILVCGGFEFFDGIPSRRVARLLAESAQPPVAARFIHTQLSSANGLFQTQARGIPGQRLIFESSTNLTDWIPVQTNVLSGQSMLFERSLFNQPASSSFRFRVE